VRYSVESSGVPKEITDPTVPLITIPTTLSGGEVGACQPSSLCFGLTNIA